MRAHALDLLIRFVPLAGNQHDVGSAGLADCLDNGLSAVEHDARFVLLAGLRNRFGNSRRLFTARIVGRDHDKIRTFVGSFAHQRPLAVIAVSARAEDGYEPAKVLIKPENHWREDDSGIRFNPSQLLHLVPAGRLDIDSVGLLVLTQDGRVAKTIIGETSEIEKEYIVRVASADGSAPKLSEEGLKLLNFGLSLDGKALQPAKVSWLNDDELRFILKEGKKRQIRRMCEAVGLKVLRLKRVRVGRVVLGRLPVGKWRYLKHDESF